MNIDIERMGLGGLARVRWRFELVISWGRQELLLDGYCQETRDSCRKRIWDKQKVYLRTGDMRPWRCGDPKYNKALNASEVPIPEDVEKELRDKLVEFARTVPVTRREDRNARI